MRTAHVMIMLLLCSLSWANYSDRYNSMIDANDPPNSFEDDPATTAGAYSAEPVEQPAIKITPPVQKNSLAETPDTPAADDQPTNDVGKTPSQPS